MSTGKYFQVSKKNPKVFARLLKQVKYLVEVEKLTYKQIGTKLDLNSQTIHEWCKKFGYKTQRAGVKGGSRHFRWKGGISGKGDLYEMRYRPEHPRATKAGYVLLSRLRMEKKLGRYLKSGEVVHHIKRKIKNPNHIDNLQLFSTNAEHLKHELTGHKFHWSKKGRKKIKRAIRLMNAIHRKIKSDDDLRLLAKYRPEMLLDNYYEDQVS